MLPYVHAVSKKANQRFEELLQELASRKLMSGKQTVLDLGCGNGHNTFPMVPYFEHVYGVDASRPMLADAKQHNNNPVKCRFYLGTFDRIPFQNSKFDLVFMYNSWHFVRDFDAAIKEISRTLRPGGTLIIIEPGPKSKFAFGPEKLHKKIKELERAEAYIKTLTRDIVPKGDGTGYSAFLVLNTQRPICTEHSEVKLENM